MKICRYNDDRIGLVLDAESLIDVSDALDTLPDIKWPAPLGDHFIANLETMCSEIEVLSKSGKPILLADVTLNSPVANPSKIMGAPINYQKHIEESEADDGIVSSRPISHISDWGMFLKANSALVGCGDGIKLRFTDNRNDHEMELAVIIGKKGSNIPISEAKEFIAGYAIGLDMTTRGNDFWN